MARKALIVKALYKEPKYKTRKYNRCPLCGRARGYIRRFGMCRLCFKKYALQGLIPGVRKASW
ncbi:MAG TPA: type Z 30S ribosomal protein S14 [Aquificae bacterium]|nr:type Z 30S ribosomal protein S14 [Aquificota bacterium]HIP93335.1 type Z 30S ribosomal protein S14 [Desulfurobacteriaceae bacterium]